MITLCTWEKKKATLNVCSSKDYSIGNQKQFETIWADNLHLPQIKTVILKSKGYNCTVVEHKSTYYTNPQDILFYFSPFLLGKTVLQEKSSPRSTGVLSFFLDLEWNILQFLFILKKGVRQKPTDMKLCRQDTFTVNL